MKKVLALLLGLICATSVINASAGGVLTGAPKLACEATLCLAASGGTPSECVPSLTKYFSIEIFKDGKYKPGATLNARKAFLQICPGGNSATISQVNTSSQRIKRCAGRFVQKNCGKLIL